MPNDLSFKRPGFLEAVFVLRNELQDLLPKNEARQEKLLNEILSEIEKKGISIESLMALSEKLNQVDSLQKRLFEILKIDDNVVTGFSRGGERFFMPIIPGRPIPTEPGDIYICPKNPLHYCGPLHMYRQRCRQCGCELVPLGRPK